MLADDLVQRLVHVLGHACRVTADVEVAAVLQPCEQIAAVLAHSVLHIDLLGLIAGEGEIEAIQEARRVPGVDLVLVDVVMCPVLVAEEQPVVAPRSPLLAFLQECAEWGHTRAGAHHDHRGFVVAGHSE
ncbi:Uncharacterised protein [Mycobacteroides abscessus subsp. abscessus]|nr:Uncharacterised protein [Mycobacteroides abscessus subsp. abscessus]